MGACVCVIQQLEDSAKQLQVILTLKRLLC